MKPILRLPAIVLASLCLVGVAEPNTSPVEKIPPASAAALQLSYAPVVRQAAPAVVNIYSRKVVRARPFGSMFDDPFFQRFFGRSFPFGVPQQRVQNSLGSGVVVRGDGIIVTNRHVIANAEEVTVALADRREFAAEILGEDPRTDLAVLRIDVDGEALPALRLRDSDEVEVGDIVLAIGNPFGVGQTVTSGIVSAIARSRVSIGDTDFFIQTDAAINPGNSGGALVDMTGALIGVNTAIFSKSGGSHGIGFAIPSNMVRAVVSGITDDGRIVRPWLGAWTHEINADIAESLGMPRPIGVLVEEVYRGGPSDRAGVAVGDVIIEVDGHRVDHPEAVRYRLTTRGIGDAAELKLWRRGSQRTVRVDLIAPPEDPPRQMTTLSGRHPLSGAVVANMSPALAEELGERRFEPGVTVLGVAGSGTAVRFGLRRGDRILSVNGSRVDEVRDLQGLLAKRASSWRIGIRRGEQTLEWRIAG